MATSTASQFNQSIGSLRGRSNSDNQFQKAMSDRMAMIKFDAPSAGQATINQIQAKLGSTMGAFKGIADIKATGVKIGDAYTKVKTAGNNVATAVSKLGNIGEDGGRVPQAGVRALTTDKLTPAKINIKTKTKPSLGPGGEESGGLGPGGTQQPVKTNLASEAGAREGPVARDAGGQAVQGQGGAGRLGGTTDANDAVRASDPTGTIQTTIDPNAVNPKGPMGGDGKTDAPSGQDGGDGRTNAPQGPMGGDGKTDAPDLPNVGPLDDGSLGQGLSPKLSPPKPVGEAPPSRGGSLYSNPLTSTINDAEATGQRGESILARVGAVGQRSRAVAGASQQVSSVRSNAMNVRSMISGDQSANATLGNLTDSLKSQASNIAGKVPTGGMAETSTNIHASVSQALEDFKGQIGGALSDVQEQMKGVAGQVSQVGKGVGAVGEDIANAGSKAVEGISAGLETAGAVADALGPVGDLIGLGMAIFGGIAGHKEHEDAVSANQKAQASIAAPVAQQTAQATSVSLDTSKTAQASVASHY